MFGAPEHRGRRHPLKVTSAAAAIPFEYLNRGFFPNKAERRFLKQPANGDKRNIEAHRRHATVDEYLLVIAINPPPILALFSLVQHFKTV